MIRILLVDDEIVAVNALKRRVDWQRYDAPDVLVANSMAQAQDVFAKTAIDLMLCDIEMPQGSGLDLFEWVKIHHPETECIFVTCHPDFDYVRKAMQLGSLDYILKPVDYDELDQILTETIERLNKKKLEPRSKAGGILDRILTQEQSNESDSPIDKARTYILDHLSETIHVDDIAGIVHLNSQYLMRLFKKETGLSILEYITSERMRIAKELLLKTDLSINRIADSVGYGNYSYFIKMIRRYIGMTPAAFRRKHQKQDES